MNEIEKAENDVPTVIPRVELTIGRMLLGLIWIVVVFGVVIGAFYLAWPWVMEKVHQFYN